MTNKIFCSKNCSYFSPISRFTVVHFNQRKNCLLGWIGSNENILCWSAYDTKNKFKWVASNKMRNRTNITAVKFVFEKKTCGVFICGLFFQSRLKPNFICVWIKNIRDFLQICRMKFFVPYDQKFIFKASRSNDAYKITPFLTHLSQKTDMSKKPAKLKAPHYTTKDWTLADTVEIVNLLPQHDFLSGSDARFYGSDRLCGFPAAVLNAKIKSIRTKLDWNTGEQFWLFKNFWHVTSCDLI